MWQKVLVDERGPVFFLACVRAEEEEEQPVQKKIVPQVYLSTAIVRLLLLFTILPAVMCANSYIVVLHKRENQK